MGNVKEEIRKDAEKLAELQAVRREASTPEAIAKAQKAVDNHFWPDEKRKSKRDLRKERKKRKVVNFE